MVRVLPQPIVWKEFKEKVIYYSGQVKQYKQPVSTVLETTTDSEVYVDELDDEDPLNIDRFLSKLCLDHFSSIIVELTMQ